MAPSEPFAFASTRCVLTLCAPGAAALTHVVTLVDTLLDVSGRIDLASAARVGAFRLFDHIADRVDVGHSPSDRSHLYAQALSSAIASGSLTIVQAIDRRHPEVLTGFPMRTAVRCGQLEILAWLFENRHDETCTPLPPAQYPRGSLKCCMLPLAQHAVTIGHARVARWFSEQGYAFRMETTLADKAAHEGDLETVQWLHGANAQFTHGTMDTAARYGHLEIIKFLHRHRKEGCSSLALIYAIVYEHDEVATYLRETKLCTDVDEGIIYIAAHAGRVDLLEKYIPLYASGEGSVTVLRRALTSALMEQRLAVLQWLYHEKGVTGMPVAMAVSEKPVDMDLIQWIHDNDCGNWNVLALAIEYGHATLLRWLHAHRRDGCEGRHSWMIEKAAARGHLEVVQTLHELYPNETISSEFAMDGAASAGHLHIIQWLHTHRSEGCSPLALDNAISAGHRDVARWLFGNYPDFNEMRERPYRSLKEVDLALEKRDRVQCSGILVHFKTILQDGDLVSERRRREAFAHAAMGGHLHAVQWLAAHLPDSFRRDEIQRVAEGARQPHIVAWVQAISDDAPAEPEKPRTRQSVAQWLRRLRRGGAAATAS